MPSVTILSDTAAARYAVAPFDSAVNDILERLKEISEHAEDVSDRLFATCSAADRELADVLLEIEIVAHELDELVNLINKHTS